MKTKDRIKEEIGLYKLLMTIFSAIASSVMSWIFSDGVSKIIVIIGWLVIIGLVIAIIKIYFKIITNLEDLDYV